MVIIRNLINARIVIKTTLEVKVLVQVQSKIETEAEVEVEVKILKIKYIIQFWLIILKSLK